MLKLILPIVLLLVLLSCSEKQEAQWTILVYMAADNNLNSAALNDIQEMISADFSEEINLIVQIDESDLSSDPTAKRYQIRSGQLNQISNLGEIDSGDYNVLTQFANWGFQNYPARSKALFIWGHGNGWYNAYNRFCPDNQSGSAISVPDGEFALAMKNINSHLDILVLDACNMLTIEVISEVYQYADFILGSETEICPNGFPYDEILTLWEDYTNIQILADQLALTYANSYMPNGSQNPFSDPLEIAVANVNTSFFPALLDAISEFVIDWQNYDEPEIFLTARNNCQIDFNDFEADIDIKDYFTKLLEISELSELSVDCEFMLDLIDQTFSSQYYIDLEDPNSTQDYPAGTASIWFPTEQQQYENLLPEFEKLKFSETGWQIFVEIIYESYSLSTVGFGSYPFASTK